MDVNKFVEFRNKLSKNVGEVIIGKEHNIDKIIVAFICSGHVLLDDVPGVGKTKLAKAFAKSLNCSFKRIQFTPDLMPSDLTGIYFYNQKSGEFEFRKGPLLSQFVLADEINRATPRTQAALLECMEERQITVEGDTMALQRPFFVMGTQNPIEQAGTFPLPEAQLDRFFIKLNMGYPKYEEEIEIMNNFMVKDPLENLHAVITEEDILYVQQNYVNIHISDEIKIYIMDIITATRQEKSVEVGASPRATISLMKAGQALAAMRGRDYVIPEDIKEVAGSVLSHRIVLKNTMSFSENSNEKVINKILDNINAPLEKI